MNESLSALEKAAIALTASEHWPGFIVEGLEVIRRENTGAGRYVYIKDTNDQSLVDGTYSAQFRMIEMDRIRNGLGFVIDVSSSRINYLELFTFGNETWDGVEREWRIV